MLSRPLREGGGYKQHRQAIFLLKLCNRPLQRIQSASKRILLLLSPSLLTSHSPLAPPPLLLPPSLPAPPPWMNPATLCLISVMSPCLQPCYKLVHCGLYTTRWKSSLQVGSLIGLSCPPKSPRSVTERPLYANERGSLRRENMQNFPLKDSCRNTVSGCK